MYSDPRYGDYLALHVQPKFYIDTARVDEFHLFVSLKDPFGFLVPAEAEKEDPKMIPQTAQLQQALQSTVWFMSK